MTAYMPARQTHRTRDDFYASLLARADDVTAKYRAETPRSAELLAQAQRVYPGGYTRESTMRNPHPPFIREAQGSTMIDADGRRLTDMWFNATSLPLGHAPPTVVDAINGQASRGTAYFSMTEAEVRHAALLADRIPSAERVRFTNSGSEAVMMAVRFARAARRRPMIVKFEGSYHGSYDDVSWSTGPSSNMMGEASSPSPVADTAGLVGAEGRTAILPFNDAQRLEEWVVEHHDSIAAILVEPLANRMGLVLPDRPFLLKARELCDRYGVLLIFDEVIAFRLGYNGAQGEVKITPDLTTLGKVIGGGFPVGAVVGRADILDLSAASGAERVAHTGTFNGNPMMAVAGFATMSALEPNVFDQMNTLGARLRAGLDDVCEGLPLQVGGAGSVFKITATDRPIRNYRDSVTANKTWEQVASLALLNEGFFVTTALSGCVSTVTTEAQVSDFIAAFRSVVRT